MRPVSVWLFVALLAAGTAMAQIPEIAYVTEPVVHFAPFLVFGEGFDADRLELLTWAPPEPADPDKLLEAILARGLPAPPATPPPEALVGLYGRVHRMSPQVLGAVMQGPVSVIWVRSAGGSPSPTWSIVPNLSSWSSTPALPARRSASSGGS